METGCCTEGFLPLSRSRNKVMAFKRLCEFSHSLIIGQDLPREGMGPLTSPAHPHLDPVPVPHPTTGFISQGPHGPGMDTGTLGYHKARVKEIGQQ